MKTLQRYITEKILINKNSKLPYNYYPKTKEELKDIIDMSDLFEYSDFNGDISKWNVSNVKTMYGMFYKSEFNGNIYKWNVSNVKNMECMFMKSNFNSDISNWDVSNVKSMHEMFYECPIEEKYKPKFKK